MKIALPSRMNQIDEHFGHCEHFTVFTIDSGKQITAEEKIASPAGCGWPTARPRSSIWRCATTMRSKGGSLTAASETARHRPDTKKEPGHPRWDVPVLRI